MTLQFGFVFIFDLARHRLVELIAGGRIFLGISVDGGLEFIMFTHPSPACPSAMPEQELSHRSDRPNQEL